MRLSSIKRMLIHLHSLIHQQDEYLNFEKAKTLLGAETRYILASDSVRETIRVNSA